MQRPTPCRPKACSPEAADAGGTAAQVKPAMKEFIHEEFGDEIMSAAA